MSNNQPEEAKPKCEICFELIVNCECKAKADDFPPFQTYFVCNCGVECQVRVRYFHGVYTCRSCQKNWYYDIDEDEDQVLFAPVKVEDADRPKAKAAELTTDELIKEVKDNYDLGNDYDEGQEGVDLLYKLVDRIEQYRRKVDKAIQLLRPIQTMCFYKLEDKTKPIVSAALKELENLR